MQIFVHHHHHNHHYHYRIVIIRFLLKVVGLRSQLQVAVIIELIQAYDTLIQYTSTTVTCICDLWNVTCKKDLIVIIITIDIIIVIIITTSHHLVSLAAVLCLVTQRSSPQTAAHIRTTFLSHCFCGLMKGPIMYQQIECSREKRQRDFRQIV